MKCHNRTTQPLQEKLLRPVVEQINGKPVTLGTCCMCGRTLGKSHLNKTGVRCYYEGSQYDRDGKKLFDARTETLYRAVVRAKKEAEGDSNDAEHDALLALIAAAEGVLP